MVESLQEYEDREAPYTEKDIKEVIGSIYAGKPSCARLAVPTLTPFAAGSDTVRFVCLSDEGSLILLLDCLDNSVIFPRNVTSSRSPGQGARRARRSLLRSTSKFEGYYVTPVYRSHLSRSFAVEPGGS